MNTIAVPRGRVAPAPAVASGVTVPRATSTTSLRSRCASLRVDERDRDTLGVAIPRSEILLVVRFASFTRRGFEVHALGPRERVYRKLVRGSPRIVTARLPLGAQDSHGAAAGRARKLQAAKHADHACCDIREMIRELSHVDLRGPPVGADEEMSLESRVADRFNRARSLLARRQLRR